MTKEITALVRESLDRCVATLLPKQGFHEEKRTYSLAKALGEEVFRIEVSGESSLGKGTYTYDIYLATWPYP